jgi:hypothetical protein
MKALGFVGLSLLLGAVGPVVAGEAKKAPKDAEVRIVGEIVANDLPDKVRKHPCKIHTLKLSKDSVYIIDLESTDLDCYLRIEDAAGKQLGFNDDGGDKLNSRLRFTPPKDDAYQIIATTFAGGTGTYTLKVRVEGAAPPGAKALGLKLDNGQASAEGEVTRADPKDRVRNNPCKIYEVPLTQGKSYVIDLRSTEFDPYLRVEGPKGNEVARDDDGGGFPNARIKIAAPETGTYRISVTAFGVGLGKYTLEVRAEDAEAKVYNAAGLKIDARLAANDPKDRVRKNAAAKMYLVKMTADKTYTIDMESEEFDTFLRLEDEKGKELAQDDDSGGDLNARLTFRAPASGTYRVIATSFEGGTGPFQLRIREE